MLFIIDKNSYNDCNQGNRLGMILKRMIIMESTRINVLPIFDNQLFLEGIKSILKSVTEFDVSAEGNKLEEAENLIEQYHPDILLLDIALPKIQGIDLMKNIIRRYPEIKIIILTSQNSDRYLEYALKIGVQGYLLIDTDEDRLIRAIKTVKNGDYYYHPNLIRFLLNKYRQANLQNLNNPSNRNVSYHRPYHILTRRECDILQLLAEGKSNRKIAETVAISDKTVKNHVSSILRKMEVNDRTQAVVTAIREGWVVID